MNQTGAINNTAADARGATNEGVVTRNWWGSPSGPDENACAGNVDCSNPLTTRPNDEGESISTPTPTPPTPTAQPIPDPNADADERGLHEGTQWNVTVTRVIDGDTIEAEFPTGDTNTDLHWGFERPIWG
jgi:hypothetical protein